MGGADLKEGKGEIALQEHSRGAGRGWAFEQLLGSAVKSCSIWSRTPSCVTSLHLPPRKVKGLRRAGHRAGERAYGLREPKFNFRHPHGVSRLFCSSSPRGPSALFWTSCILHAQGAHTYRQNANMCKINTRKKIKKKTAKLIGG